MLLAGALETVSVTKIPGIYELSVQYPQTVSLMLYLSDVKYLPSDVPEAPGEVYNYFEMLFTKFKTNIKIDPVTEVYFKVPKDVVTDKDRITLMRYENGWDPIKTNVIDEDGDYYYYMAEVTSYSIFSITQTTAEPGGSGDFEVPVISEQGAQEPTPVTTTDRLPIRFELIMLIFALLVALGYAYYVLSRKRL